MFTFELAEQLRAAGESGVTVNALHPASLMNTKMVMESFGYTMSTVQEATLRLVVAPDLEGHDRLVDLSADIIEHMC
jgi:hypothetical protein